MQMKSTLIPLNIYIYFNHVSNCFQYEMEFFIHINLYNLYIVFKLIHNIFYHVIFLYRFNIVNMIIIILIS